MPDPIAPSARSPIPKKLTNPVTWMPVKGTNKSVRVEIVPLN